MPRTFQVTKTVYNYDELSPKAKEAALDYFRSTVDSLSSDCVIEDATMVGAYLGISVNKVYYSGFSSQGDGACFVGNYIYQKGAPKLIKSNCPKDTTLQRIAKELQALQKRNGYALKATVKHRGHYYHEHCTDIDVTRTDDKDVSENDADELQAILRVFMKWIYKSLEQDYYYQCSEEAIKETIDANGYEFSESGKLA